MVIEQSKQIISEVNKAFIGKADIVEKVLMTIYAGGHILLEDCPGVGKTTLVLAFSQVFGLKSNRIQLTGKPINLNTARVPPTVSCCLQMR